MKKWPVALACVMILGAWDAIRADEPSHWWSDAVERQLVKAQGNRPELESALNGVPRDERTGMAFIIANMPDADLTTLKGDFLKTNHELAYKARNQMPWGKAIPEEIYFNNVLPYANVDEKRDPWRKEFFDLCMPIVKDCKTPSEVTQKLNSELFKTLKLKYAPQRRPPNLSPKESIQQGTASCTGLSIVLSDACRSVGVPTRLVGTPNWSDNRGNHTWIEIWDRDWHFTGACEPDPSGLDRGWFVGDAAKAKKDSPEHAIYAVSFRKTDLAYPLVWARNKKTVMGENVTDRYAKSGADRKDTVHVAIRVLNAEKKRVPMRVVVTAAGETKSTFEGTSRGESADLNDFVAFDLQPQKEYVIKVGSVDRTIRTSRAGESQIVEIVVADSPSSQVIQKLRTFLAGKPRAVSDVLHEDFARTPLTHADAVTARKLLWDAHAAWIRQERAAEITQRLLKDGKREMPFAFTIFGQKPKEGRSLWISLHGGGNAPKSVNDQQWQNQKKLYTLDEGIYLAPRAPTDTWNLWHEDHIDRLFARLIEDLIVLEDVNPDRVYVLGYSAGGDGVYQLAPRMADTWAAAAMMAGHPNGVSLLSLRNVPFALQVGGNDSAYNRNKVALEYGDQLDKLHADDPKGYQHMVKIHEGKPHWMNREDKIALPWMAEFRRNPVPDRVVWKQTGAVHDRSYWLAVPAQEAKGGSLVIAQRNGQKIEITKAENVGKLLVRLDERMGDLDQRIVISHEGKELYSGIPTRTIATLASTLAGRGDPRLMFDAEIPVNLAK